MFDAELFLNQTINDANATEMEPIPEGEYPATSASVSVRNPGKSVILEVLWNIDDEVLADQLGRDKLSVRQSIFLDIDDQGRLETGKGKNVQLGRLRETLGQNQAGRPWSPQDLVGHSAMIYVKHRTTDDGRTFDQVSSVAPL